MTHSLAAATCLTFLVIPTRSAQPQAADESSWKVSGYVLSLYTRSQTIVPPAERFVLDLNRLRLKLDAKPTVRLGLDVQFDSEVLLGSYLRTAQHALTRDRAETAFDLQHEYVARDELVARHGLYRAMLRWSGADTDVKVGRQRIALGTGFFWSPMDLLNPIDPTRLERDYRPGADAVLVEQRLGALSRVSGIYAPSNSEWRSVAAGYLHANVGGADYSALIGSFRGDDVVGADFAGRSGGLGLRGEATFTRANDGRRYARGLLGADYGFASSLNLTAEAYYNGRGTSDPARYDFGSLLAGRALNLARLYGGLSMSYQVTPLVKIAGFAVLNVDDRSGVLWPRVEWSARTNLDIVAGLQRFGGRDESEYGRLSKLLHGEVRWFF
jgi:hypothetical protein